MTDTQKTLADMAKILTKQAQQIKKLEADKRTLTEQLNMWQNTFLAFAQEHFKQGGTAPNLPMSAISNTTAPADMPFEMINNNDYVTVTVRR